MESWLKMVIDTSAILAVFFKEDKGLSISKILQSNSKALFMSTVNLAETLILIEDRQPKLLNELKKLLINSSIQFIPPSYEHAELAAKARFKYPLNLGDCFAYALARSEHMPLLTLDKDFKKTDLRLVF